MSMTRSDSITVALANSIDLQIRQGAYKEIFAVIRSFKAHGVTILLVEQMANQALKVADRAYVLKTGEITSSGDAAQLLADPAVREAYLGKHQ
jgi:branched-chain amino acid transport system ATP-binding protein